MEAQAVRAQDGFAKLGARAVLEHRFDPETLGQILRFCAAERAQAFVKELKKAAAMMENGALPGPNDADASRRAARALKDDVLEPFRALRDLDADAPKDLVETQRKRFAMGGARKKRTRPWATPPRQTTSEQRALARCRRRRRRRGGGHRRSCSGPATS